MLVLTDDREYAIGWDTPNKIGIQHSTPDEVRVRQGELLLALEEPNPFHRAKVLTQNGRIFWLHTEWLRIVS